MIKQICQLMTLKRLLYSVVTIHKYECREENSICSGKYYDIVELKTLSTVNTLSTVDGATAIMQHDHLTLLS
jgi:hypothetical protein